MPATVMDSSIYGTLFAEPESAALFSDHASVKAMVRVEAALARVQGHLGLIPDAASQRIDDVLRDLHIPPEQLAGGTASAGVPIPPLVAALRQAVGEDAAPYVHRGATSQDIVDTGLVLRLAKLLDQFDARLHSLGNNLTQLAHTHRSTVIAARTRSQQATPTVFGLKVAGWMAPLRRCQERLAQLRPRLLVVQLGGASGNLAAMNAIGTDGQRENRGLALMDGLAAELGLASAAPWHSQRDNLAELAGWFSLVTASLGKMGTDVVRLAQSEVAEVRPGRGGGSSTMPQKSNPVAAELLVSVARFNASLLGGMHEACVHEHERDGSAWNLEWMTLPQMAVATGAALHHAALLLESLEVLPDRMRRNVERSNGLLLAEAAAFALAEHMPLPTAQSVVAAACKRVGIEERHLVDILRDECDAAVDWETLRNPAACVGAAAVLIDRITGAG